MTMLRADMHVHTCYSRYNDDIAFLGARDCYSTPEQVYATAKARGMDLVAITDHDTIDGALALVDATRGAADVIVGEEVSCWFPDGPFQVHLGVYGMTESLHRELQPLRRSVFDVIACLRHAGVFFCVNHLMHFWQEHVPLDRYLELLMLVPALEVRNGTMVPKHNRLSERIAADPSCRGGRPLAAVAGSDAHTLRRVGTTWTEAPGRTREEFLENVRNGLGVPGGRDGGALAVSGDAYGVIRGYICSLLGILPPDHHGLRRLGCLAFAIGSLPFEFFPLLLVSRTKMAERRKVKRLEEALAQERAGLAVADARA
ncbi:MAG: PHP domain-containing protein [Vicinamibacterales bacterium]